MSKTSPSLRPWNVPKIFTVIVMLAVILAIQGKHLSSHWYINLGRVEFVRTVLRPDLPYELRNWQVGKSAQFLEAAQGYDANEGRVYFAKGQLSQYLRQTDVAALVFERAIALDKRDVVSWWYLADLYYGRGDVALAIQAWRKAGVARDKAVEFWWQGVYQERAEKFEEARRAYRIAIDLLPDYIDAYYGYISACWGQSRQTQPDCLDVANRLMILDKTDSSRRAFEEGRLALLNGQTEAAIAAFQKSLSIDPSYCLAHRFLIVSLQQAGRSFDAAEAMKRKILECGE